MNIAQRFNEEFQKELMAREFDVDLPCDWKAAARDALSYASPLSLGVNALEFKSISDAVDISIDKKLTLFQFAILSNNLEARTAKELQMFLPGYIDLILMAGEFSKKWNEVTKDLREEVTKRITTDEQMKAAAAGENKTRPAGMGAVKAQA